VTLLGADWDDFLQAAILGAIQAVTEFLPISSSGHLVLAPELIGDDVSSLTFDVAVHLGTMVAVIGYFWRDWLRIIASGFGDVARHRVALGNWSDEGRLGLWIALGTIPALVIGLAFEEAIEEQARSPVLVAAMLILFGLVIWVLDSWGATMGRLFDIGAGRALVVGFAQAVALVPGVSRSGITIAAARGLGIDRAAAARFSFLLSAPVVLGAGVLQMAEAFAGEEEVVWAPMLVGAVVSAVLGAFVIRGLLAFLTHHTLRVFVWYRIALGLSILALAAFGVV
jgi:undecaprenyl-diphosphatase